MDISIKYDDFKYRSYNKNRIDSPPPEYERSARGQKPPLRGNKELDDYESNRPGSASLGWI